jgi:hypothetical protein
MDQIPLPFILRMDKTLHIRGEPVYIAKPKGSSGLSKRQASIQLCIRAQGRQVVRIAVIFAGQGMQVTDEEARLYQQLSPFLQVYFQPKAWADEAFIKNWFNQFLIDTAGILGEKLLGMDCHGAQQTMEMRRRYQVEHVQPAFTPPECTDCVSPCDHHIPKVLKDYIGESFGKEFEANARDWQDTGLTASQRRMCMARWVAAAYLKLQVNQGPNGSNLLYDAFVKTGFLLNKDGSDDHKVDIGIPNYTF